MLQNMLDTIKKTEDEADTVIAAAKADADRLKKNAEAQARIMIRRTQEETEKKKAAVLERTRKEEEEKDLKYREETDSIAEKLRYVAFKQKGKAEKMLKEKMFSLREVR